MDDDLRALEARYRALVLATGQVTWTARRDGSGLVGDGRDWCLFTGQEPGAAREWGWRDALHPDDRDRAIAALDAAASAQSTYEIDCRVRRYDGEYRWMLVRGVPVLEADGSLREWVGTATDITERKQAEVAWRETEERLAAELADTQRVQHISSQLIQEGNLEALYQQILDAAIAVMRSDMGSMQMLYPDRGALRLLAWKGFDPASAVFWEWVRPDAGSTCGVTLRTGERVIVPEVETCDFMVGTEDLDFYRLSGIKAVQSTPLVARDGRLVGMISTHWRTPHEPAERELRLLDVLARQAADLIERMRAEIPAAHLAAIVTSAEDAIVGKTLDGVVTSWNASAERIFGYSSQEMIGQPMRRIIPPDRHHEEDLILARIRAGERVEHFETVRMAKDGHPIDVSLTISPIRDSAGTIIGASKIVRDITAPKQVEWQLGHLQRLTTRFAEAQTAASVRRIMLDDLAKILGARGAGLRLVTPEAGLLLDDYALGPSSLSEEAVHRFDVLPLDAQHPAAEAARTGEPVFIRDAQECIRRYPLVAEFVRRDQIEAVAHLPLRRGKQAFAVLSLPFAEPHAWNGAEQTFAVALAERAAVSYERARAVEALTASEEKFRTLADNIPALAWMAHPDGNIFWYNRRWYAYTGTTPESQEGWGWQSVHDPDTLPDVMARWKVSLATGEPFEMVFPLRGADGEFRPFLTRVLPVTDERGQVVRWFGSNTDVSDLRAAEEALLAANQLMDEFLHMATHELKSPLTALRANLQISERRVQRLLADLARTPPTCPAAEAGSAAAEAVKPLREAIEGIARLLARNERQVRKLTRLVDDLVDAARIQAAKLEIRPAACDLAEVVRETVAEQEAVYPARAIRLQVHASRNGRAVLVVADADRIGQVVTNYLTNAIKYSAGDRPVEVTLRAEGGAARVSVRDEGPGIPAHEHEHVWERGHRVPGVEPTGEGVGLGLGLHISRSIVERHGGAVGLESAPGAGSTFWFTLPLMPYSEDTRG